jgi:hypothetical protein
MIPTVAEERELAARRRAGLAAAAGPWKSYGLFVSLVFFGFAALGVAAAHALFHEIRLPTAIVGVAAIVIAERLIAAKWFGTGVESALWLGGLFSLIFSLPGEERPEALLLFAAASALAGWRVRNPLFGALAAVFVASYLEALVFSLAVAAIACAALLREWRRPSTEWLWIATLIAMIPAAYFCGDPQRFHALIFLAAAVVLLVAGIAMRHHAPFVASAIALVIAGGEWFDDSNIPLERLLGVSGALLLAVAFALSRALRERKTGFVTTPMQLPEAGEVLEQVSVIAAAPHETGDTPQTGRAQGDGSFGGAGATGEF